MPTSTPPPLDGSIVEDAFNLSNFMDGVLDRVRQVYASYNVPLPARQYWTFGEPAYDCEQVVVSFINLYLGPPGDEANRPVKCNQPRTAVVRISVVRQTVVQQGTKAPKAQDIEDSARWQALDAWILIESNQLFDNWDEFANGPGVIATITAGTASGGYQEVSMQLTITVP